jgi:glycogen debranching enzyme
VQGYVYAAFLAMSSMAEWQGDSGAARWRQRAEAMREAVESRFWLDDLKFYALAIDGANQPCRVRASNAGHLLFTGLPGEERALSVGHQLLSSAFASGWGIRTLPTEAVRFNPMSYHNGSVWPHDVALCAAGLAHYGERDGVVRILDNLFETASHFGMRLPELFCGFDRQPGQSPVAYPVACLPQAWAAGSVFMLLQACLGLHVDGIRREVKIVRPQLPADIDQLHVQGLQVGSARVDLHFQRLEERIVVVAQSAPGTPKVDVNLQL